MTEAVTITCVRRSKLGITCGERAVAKVDGQDLCSIHAQEASIKKAGKNAGRPAARHR